MRCVGYRQAWEALDEGLSGPALRAAVTERGVAATRQLAKRQLTWLRSLPCQALAADAPDLLDQVLPGLLALRRAPVSGGRPAPP
jgi:tRNA dimethylallyltransferase